MTSPVMLPLPSVQLTLLAKQVNALVEWDIVRRYVLERYGPRAVRARTVVRHLYTVDTDSLVTRLTAYDEKGKVCEYDLTLPFFRQPSVREELLQIEVKDTAVALRDQIAPIDRAYWDDGASMVSFVDWYDLPAGEGSQEWDITTPPPLYFVILPVTEQDIAANGAYHRSAVQELQQLVLGLYAAAVRPTQKLKGDDYATGDTTAQTA